MIMTFVGVPESTSKYVQAILADAMVDESGANQVDMITVDDARMIFDSEGPYLLAKRLGLLVENSAEDMAIDFMTYVNSVFPSTY